MLLNQYVFLNNYFVDIFRTLLKVSKKTKKLFIKSIFSLLLFISFIKLKKKMNLHHTNV
jgi:hypothetical protein